MEILEALHDGLLLLDGAMGTMLQSRGLRLGERPELFSITHPQVVEGIHREYIEAGAQVVYANTFGANAHKLAGTGHTPAEVIEASVRAAKAACAGTNATKVALDVGPIGELLAPAGSLGFDEAYALFKEQIDAGVRCGADLIVIETMTDLYEVKAALLAAKENSELPVFVTMTFERGGRTFTGCSVSAMALTLEGLGADAIGINCSLGPKEIYPIAKELSAWTRLPLIVKANAGLPDPQTGKYDVTPEAFAGSALQFMEIGVSAIGGCCGTTPEYIARMRETLSGKCPAKREYPARAAICTPTKTVAIDGVAVIGERINPTGKKLFKQALIEHNMDYILSQAIAQIEADADILDVNVGLPEIDEAAMLPEVVCRLQAVIDAPLQLDSSNAKALENALRLYNGKPVVNSVNGEAAVLERILPLVKKYGAAVVGLTLDENGIPPKAGERFAIAQRILDAALRHGIRREDVYIDCLTLTASVQQKEVMETLKAVQMVKERLGLKTVLGVSNISFGLPGRELINQSFLTLALAHGLDLPIINPNIPSMMGAVAAFRVLYNQDEGAKDFIAKYAQEKGAAPVVPVQGMTIEHAILRGLAKESRELAKALLADLGEMELVNDRLIPALDEVGSRVEQGKLFLPQLLQAAGAAQAAFEVVKERIAAAGKPSVSKGKILLATVKGDIHDIGKNIVKVILENYGYQIIDLGRDVPVARVVDEAVRQEVRLVGLSALMTTTLPSMEATIKALHERLPGCKVFVGGAVLTADYAGKIGADFYARDAKQSVDIAREILG